ncbi:MAG: MFS transporter [Verrucomicrobia bacterium]|nr:MAG: MFS transporter [Verrucomicrobiota bacterium]
MDPTQQSEPRTHLPDPERGNFRWLICALLFLGTTVNYVDRQVISLLKPVLADQFKWTETNYAHIIFWFQAAYAVGLLTAGGILDRIGVRLGYSLAVIFWSIAAVAHGFARTVVGFGAARFGLGLAESANFPAAIKAVGEWFPKKERALATGLLNSGANVGALVAPVLVPWLFQVWGWQAAFYATGAVGLVWVFLWWPLYRSPEHHPTVSRVELDLIRSDPPDPPQKYPWSSLLSHRQTWGFALGKFLTDPWWWFFLFWVPPFLNKQFHVTVDPVKMGLPVLVIYTLSAIGSIGGGWLSSRLIQRGWTVNAARKIAMLLCAIAVMPISFASKTATLWPAVLLIGLATAAHQGFSANIFTIVSDTVPRKAVGSVTGIGGMAGAVGGMLLSLLVGPILEKHGDYLILFVMAAFSYLLALAVIHLFLPGLEPMPEPRA